MVQRTGQKKSAERFKRLPVEEQERRKRANGFAAKRWRKQKQMDGTWETYTRELNERRRQQRAAKMAAMSKEEHLAHNRERYRWRKANEEEKQWRWLEFNLLAPFPLVEQEWMYCELVIPPDPEQTQRSELLTTIVDSL